MIVSIIIPVYNTSYFLSRCINSVINQSYTKLEIIIVNDGSTDCSLEIIQAFDDTRIRVINKPNGGIASARNTGVINAKGEYIVQIDSDDYVELDYIEKMLHFALTEEIDIVVCDYYSETTDGVKKYCIDTPIGNKQIISSENYLEMLFNGEQTLPMVWNKLMKTELFHKNLIRFPDNVGLGEDLFVTPVLAFHSKKIGKLNNAFYHYISNPDSITKNTLSNKIHQIQFVLDYLQIFFKNRDLSSYYLYHLNPRMLELTNKEIVSQKYKREIWNYLYVKKKGGYILGTYSMFVVYRLICNTTRNFRNKFL